MCFLVAASSAADGETPEPGAAARFQPPAVVPRHGCGGVCGVASRERRRPPTPQQCISREGLSTTAAALGALPLLEGFPVTTLDTAIRRTRYMIEKGWMVIFGRYDIFADLRGKLMSARTAAKPTASAARRTQPAGAADLTQTIAPALEPAQSVSPVQTPGLWRAVLQLPRNYWVNSGIAVALMLLLDYGNGYLALWRVWGSANQLPAAITPARRARALTRRRPTLRDPPLSPGALVC